MKRSTFISILALLIAAAGAVVAFLAYFGKRKCVLCDDFDDFDDDLMAEEPNDIEYYAAEMETVSPDETQYTDDMGGSASGNANEEEEE